MIAFQQTLQDTHGNVVPLAGVEVRTTGGSLASIFADEAGTVPIVQPFETTTDGLIQFWAAGGEYDVIAAFAGAEVTKRIALVSVGSVNDALAVTLAAAEAARDAAIVSAQTYANEATGRAAVADGQTFDVQGSGETAVLRYRRTNSTASVLIATFPSKAAVDARAPKDSPAFTGTPTGITKTHVGLSAVDNTADADKPLSAPQASAIGNAVDPFSAIETGDELYVQLPDGTIADVSEATADTGRALVAVEHDTGVTRFFAGLTAANVYEDEPDEWRYIEGVGTARHVVEWEGKAVLAILDTGKLWCNLDPRVTFAGVDPVNYVGPGTVFGLGSVLSAEAYGWTVSDARGAWDYIQPINVSGAPAILRSRERIAFILAMGESISVGGGVAALADAAKTLTKTAPNPASSLMLGGSEPSSGMFGLGTPTGVFLPGAITHFAAGVENFDTSRGETHGSGMLRWIDEAQDFNLSPRRAFLFHSAGASGARIDQIAKGTQPYTNAINAVTKARALAQDIYGTDLWLPAVTLTIGVNDRGAGTSAEDFEAEMRQFMIDLRADLAAILPDDNPAVEFLIHQTASNGTNNGNPIQLVQAALCDELSYARLMCPIYQLPFDGVHPTPLGYRRMGEMTGIAWDQLYRRADTATPLEVRPLTAGLSGNVWTVLMSAPAFPLVLDTVTYGNAGNYGFEHVDDGGTTTITGVTLTQTTVPNDTVQVTLSGTPGANPRLRYAYNVLRGNLRDSSAEVSRFETYNLHRWCRTFEMEPE